MIFTINEPDTPECFQHGGIGNRNGKREQGIGNGKENANLEWKIGNRNGKGKRELGTGKWEWEQGIGIRNGNGEWKRGMGTGNKE